MNAKSIIRSVGDAGRDLLAARERAFGSSGPPLTEQVASRAQQPLKTANKREGDGGRQWRMRKGEGPSGQGEAASRGDQGFFYRDINWTANYILRSEA